MLVCDVLPSEADAGVAAVDRAFAGDQNASPGIVEPTCLRRQAYLMAGGAGDDREVAQKVIKACAPVAEEEEAIWRKRNPDSGYHFDATFVPYGTSAMTVRTKLDKVADLVQQGRIGKCALQ
jgi:hypothetical protein